MTLEDLFDDPSKRQVAREADEQLKRRLDLIETEIGNLHSELAEASKRNDELAELAKLAVGALAEIVVTHGQLPQRTEVDLAGRLLHAVHSSHVKMDPILRQNLEVLSTRTIR